MKKIISTILSAAMALSIMPSVFAQNFPDVEKSSNYSKSVEVLSKLNIIDGDENGLFNPDKTVTRAEFTKMAVGALGEIKSAEAQTNSTFSDAANTSVHWAAGYVAQGVADGFINGYDDVTFGPDDQVTYAQACKMLVAAIGYTTYAEAAGGWPAGYVSQASSLGITKGVSATNDAALTRAQCAVLIYNAMDVPLCVIDSWETTSTITGPIQTPVLKKLDGKENRDFQTLLTDKHDAYKVKGRVMANAKGSADGLKKDEVKYDVEVADNFDDEINIKKANGNVMTNQIFKVGDTNAADMLFAYTEAIVKKDSDADEFTIISIENYGNSKTVEFKADDVADDDTTVGTEYIEKGKIPVYKNSSTSSTTKYDLADGVIMYVNGVEVGAADDLMINDYILNNKTGTVTLVDKTEVGSTSTDNKYDYILVSYYVDAVVDYTISTASYARVYFKDAQTKATKMEWDPDDQDVDITFTKDDKKVAYTDLQEFDVLSIQYNIVDEGVGSDSLTNKEYYNVLVSSNKVEGDVTSRDTEEQTITIGGNEYDLVEVMTTTDDYELGTQYQVYIDAFGYVAHFEEGSSDKNYGVIVAMYTSSGDDYPTVRFITSDAKVVAYECKDMAEATKFYNYAMTGDEKGSDSYKAFTKNDIANQIKAGETVCTYKLTSGKIKFDKSYNGLGGEDLEYKANSSKIGSYSISDAVTKIIDMDAYMNGNDTSVKTLSVASFEDDTEYDAFFFDKNTDSIYRFAIVFNGTSSIRPETQLAVVKKSNGQKDVDTTTCSSYTVFRGGNEEEMFFEDENSSISEGAVIAYIVGSEGYVELGDMYTLYTPASSYDASLANILADNDFGKLLTNVSVVASGKNAGKYEINFDGKTSGSKDVLVFVGIVHKKGSSNVELFTKQAAGVSQIAEITDFSLGGANVYTYDYNERSNKGTRLSNGNSGTQTTSVYNQAYINDKNAVQWDALDGATPQIAFIKEVDGDVTDAVFYVAP